MKKAIFPGSFDPITVGHEAVIVRALPLFDRIVVSIGINSNKHASYMFSLEERLESLKRCFAGEPRIEIDYYEGLTINYCRRIEANYILRGLRIAADFEYERNIALMNRTLAPEVETIFLLSQPEYSAITSTVVRDILRNGGDVSSFVPMSFFVK